MIFNIKKPILWLILFVFFVVVLAVLTAKWMRTDEPLTDVAIKFIQPDLIYNAKIQQHSYFYLLGIDAKDDVNPDAMGRYRYHREWAGYIQEHNKDQYREIVPELSKKLTREGFSEEETELIKKLQTSLVQSAEQFSILVVDHKKMLQVLIEREHIPLQRLSHLLERKDYISLVMPLQANGPDYAYIRNLQLLKLVQIQLEGSLKMQMYVQQFHQVLDFSQNGLSLSEKMLMQNWLSQMIDLIRLEQKNVKSLIMLKHLDSDQLGLKVSLQNELMGSFLLTRYLASSSDVSAVQLKWLYLPNKTFNAIAAQYEVYWRLSEIPYAELKQQFAMIEYPSVSKWHLKNAVGHILSQVGKPHFEKYLLMNHVLNNKIFSFNAVSHGILDIDVLNENPDRRRYFKKEGKLCVELPFPKHKLTELNLKQDSCVEI